MASACDINLKIGVQRTPATGYRVPRFGAANMHECTRVAQHRPVRHLLQDLRDQGVGRLPTGTAVRAEDEQLFLGRRVHTRISQDRRPDRGILVE